MATFVTNINDEIQVLMETETTGAFSKSEGEMEASPIKAFQNSVKLIGVVAEAMAQKTRAQLPPEVTGSLDVSLGIKVDGSGAVMISQLEGSQFRVTMRFDLGRA